MSGQRPRLAVFGGSFDPPHLGHALMPGYLLARGLADAVVLVPCWTHALGKVSAPFERRMAWTRAAIGQYDARVWVSDIEAELAETTGGPSYALNMLQALARRHPDHRLQLVVGSDIVDGGETDRWHRWEAIEADFEPIIVPRAGVVGPHSSGAHLPEVSSSEIRAWTRLADGGGEGARDAEEALARALPAEVLRAYRQPAAGRVWVIGRGNAASHLIPWLQGRDPWWSVVPGSARGLLATREDADARRAHRQTLDEGVDAVWLLGRDGQTTELAEALVNLGLDPAVPVLHAGGSSRSEDCLAPLRRAGHPVGTLHPICAMRSERPRAGLERAGWGIEGDPAARALALAWIGEAAWVDLAGLDANERRAYHAACALVANHLGVLVAEAQSGSRVLREDSGRAILLRLLAGAAENLAALGVPAGVTGPVARGELDVARAHAAALGGEPGALYGRLSERLAEILRELA